MIHFFAGAHKNGSHFQFYVLEEALRQRSIPYRIVGLDVFHERDLNRSQKLLAELRGTDEIILCKGHWYRRRERTLLLGQKNIRIFLIWRNLKDVLISSYHYNVNKFGFHYAGFSEYYFEGGGRELLIAQRLYRIAWSGKPAHETSYEVLVDDFPREAGRLLTYADVNGVDLDTLQAETGIGRLRETRGDLQGIFFRKGTTGQHRSFNFERDVATDIEKILRIDRMALIRERCFGIASRGVRKASAKVSSMWAFSASGQ